jgi:hypothetical protein
MLAFYCRKINADELADKYALAATKALQNAQIHTVNYYKGKK